MEKVKDTLRRRREASNVVTQKEFTEILRQCAKETAERRGGGVFDVQISRSAMNRIQDELQFAVVTPQTKTNARILAEADPRNVLTMGIMIKCFVRG